tara:strand:- start:1036 stop:2364 length:1329 start_codon:yes stop_codon:yes gene_type:complete
MIVSLSDHVKLRPQQIPLFDAYFNKGIRNVMRVAHRRFGKGMEAFMLMCSAAIYRRGIYGYFLPTIGQSRRVIWQTIGSDGKRLIYRFPEELVASYHHSEQIITLKNGSIIYVSGSDNYKRHIGMDFCYLVWDEYQDTNPNAVDSFRPMITRNKGFQHFLGTPRAYSHFGEMYEKHRDDPNWFVTNLTIDDTYDEFGKPIVTEEDIEQERKNGMPEELIQQEYYGSFSAAIRGAYFSEGLQLANKESRIGHFPHNPLFPTHTGWDLGWDDAMAIWVIQVYDGKIFLIDYIEDRSKGLEAYVHTLNAKLKNHRRGTDFAPHDIENHELGPGKSRKDQARAMGVNFRTVPRPSRKMHGIQAIRYMFPRFHFHEKALRKGLKHLTEYRPQYNEKTDVYSLDPLRNAATHGADALQTFCLGWMGAFEKEELRNQIKIANLYGQMIY